MAENPAPGPDGSTNSNVMDGNGDLAIGGGITMEGVASLAGPAAVSALYGDMIDFGFSLPGMSYDAVIAAPTMIIIDNFAQAIGTIQLTQQELSTISPSGMMFSTQQLADFLSQPGFAMVSASRGTGLVANFLKDGQVIGGIKEAYSGVGGVINPNAYNSGNGLGIGGGFAPNESGGELGGGGGYLEQSFDSSMGSPNPGMLGVTIGAPSSDPLNTSNGQRLYTGGIPTHIGDQMNGIKFLKTGRRMGLSGSGRIIAPGICSADGRLLIDYANTKAIFAGQPAQLITDFIAGGGNIWSLRTSRKVAGVNSSTPGVLGATWRGTQNWFWFLMANTGACIIWMGEPITAIDPYTKKTFVSAYQVPLAFWDGSRAVAASTVTWGWHPAPVPGLMTPSQAYLGLQYAPGNPGPNPGSTPSNYYYGFYNTPTLVSAGLAFQNSGPDGGPN